MTSVSAMEEEERPNSPMSSTSWAVLSEPDSLSNNGTSQPFFAESTAFVQTSDSLSTDSNYGSSEGSITDIDGISSTSETPSLVTPSHTDDDYDDVEHEYEDEYELNYGSSAATPSGWGSTPDLVDNEYEEDQRIAEENRVYMQSNSWVSTSSLDELDYDEDQDGEMPEVRGADNSASTSTEFTQPNRLSEADRAVLMGVINASSHDTPRNNAIHPPTSKSEAGNRQDHNEKQNGLKQKTFLKRFMSWIDENAMDVILPSLVLFSLLLLAILVTVSLGVACMYLPAGVVAVFQGCGQLLGFSSKSQESVVTGRDQPIITPTITPVLCENTPVFTTSSDGVQYLGCKSLTPPNMDDLISQLCSANFQGKNEAEDVQIHAVGDHHVIVRLPSHLASEKNDSKFDIKVTRANSDLQFDLYKLFDGVFTLQLAPEDAYGPMSVTVSTQSKPAINITTSVDFGTPWLKVASWKKATQSLSQALRKDFNDAQTGLSKVYIKLTFDFKKLRGAWDMNTNQTVNINDSLQHVANLARNAVAKSKALSANLHRDLRESLSSSTDQLRERAKFVQQAVQNTVFGILSTAQERASRVRVPSFKIDLKTGYRDS